jgi:hypothetical protein
LKSSKTVAYPGQDDQEWEDYLWDTSILPSWWRASSMLHRTKWSINRWSWTFTRKAATLIITLSQESPEGSSQSQNNLRTVESLVQTDSIMKMSSLEIKIRITLTRPKWLT